MPAYDDTPPVAIDITTPKTPDNTAPTAIAVNQTPDNNPPVGIAINQAGDNAAPDPIAINQTPDNSAPVGIAINQAGDNNPPVAIDITTPKTPDNTAPAAIDLTTPTTPNNAAAVPIGDAPAPLVTMPSTFTPAFNGLTGGGNCLDALSATAADIGKILTGKVGNRLKNYEVCAGNDATDSPGIIRCANFDAVTNAIVFVQR